MTIFIQGIGWLSKEGYGCLRSGLRQAFRKGEDFSSLPKKGIFSHPFKNFGRLDAISRTTSYAVALALQDAGIEYSPLKKHDIGIVGTNAEGSLRADMEYFRDYLNSGRTSSRGNLFIYTLPSSPLGEAAIHFGLRGPLLYVAGARPSFLPALDAASEMLYSSEASVMLAGSAEEEEAVFFVLASKTGGEGADLCDLGTVRPALEPSIGIAAMVQKLSAIKAV